MKNSRIKGKHLTNEDRAFIQEALMNNRSLKHISEYLCKDPTTISKEVKRNRILKTNSFEFKGGCANRKNCKVKNLCNDTCKDFCKSCRSLNCMRVCTNFKTKSCIRISRFPHVCNGCDTRINCKLDKYRYSAKHADANYREKLESSRQGIQLTPDELESLDKLVTPLILKGQPIMHIYACHEEEIPCSERTLYHYIDKCFLTARNIDLRRKPKYKTRKKKTTTKNKSNHRVNKTYDDFLLFKESNPDKEVIEMDTVIGKKGGKVLLTLFFRRSCLMIAILLEKNNQECVIGAFNNIYNKLGLKVFKDSFPIIITDNGSEFINSEAIEYDSDGNRRTHLFYCDPMASHQKPHVEKNHEYIRYILPKGESFDFLTQDKVTLMMNHINSIRRKSLNYTTAFKLAEILMNPKLIEIFSLKEVSSDDVHLKEELLDPTRIKKTLLESLK